MNLPSRIDDSLKSPHLSEVGIDIAEAILDSSITENILQEIPGFRILYGLGNAYSSYVDRIFTNKLLVFFSTFKDIPEGVRQEQIDKINEDSTHRQKVGEKLIHVINQTEDRIKAEIAGFLFRAFLLEEISYKQFMNFARVVNSLDFGLLSSLVTQYLGSWPIDTAGALIANGLYTFDFNREDIEGFYETADSMGTTVITLSEDAILTEDGQAFIKCLRKMTLFKT